MVYNDANVLPELNKYPILQVKVDSVLKMTVLGEKKNHITPNELYSLWKWIRVSGIQVHVDITRLFLNMSAVLA